MQLIKPISFMVVVVLVTVLFAGLTTVRAAAQGDTLGQALDNQKLSWWTNGTAEHYSRTFTGAPEWTQWTQQSSPAWLAQNSTWFHGGSAAESTVSNDQTSANYGVISDKGDLYTVVNGPGTLAFYWKFNTTGFGALCFYVDGSVGKSITTNSPWMPVAISIGPGQHVLKWEVSSQSPTRGQSSALVDAVTWPSVNRIPTQLAATANPTKVVGTQPFTVSGTLSTTNHVPVSGVTVQLQKIVSGTWANVTAKTNTTTATGAYRISTSERAAGTYQYRTTYAGNDTYVGANSTSVSVKVVSKASALW